MFIFQRPDDPIQFLSKYLAELPSESSQTAATPDGTTAKSSEKMEEDT